jgi:tetrahydromethanopterin S-methyltransferase subunit B
MREKIGGILTVVLFCVLILSVYATITNSWIARDINHWQAGFMKSNKYFPILTIGCLFIPLAVILLFLKLFIAGRFSKK